MALRSGYKGFKKLLGLKTIRPGTLAVDDAALANTFFPRSEQAVLGAYNIIDNVMVNHTENGVTFTVNADKSASLSGISTGDIAGHDSAHLSWNVCVSLTNLKKGRYKLIGCPAGGSGSTYRLIISNQATSVFVTDTGDGAVFDYDPDANDPWVYCYIRINSGQDMTGKVFKPMITTDLNATYDDYVAPAMTNEELTDEHAVKNLTITPATGITINAGSYAKIRNGILNAYISLKNENASISSYTQLASISGLTGKEDVNMNFAGINSSDNVFVPFYCPFNKSAGGISIQTRDTVSANKNIAVSITAILE